VRHVVEHAAKRLGRPVPEVSEETMSKLCAYSWPGNVRELENVVERAVILATDGVLRAGELGTAQSRTEHGTPASSLEDDSLEAVERRHILRALESSGWRIEGESGAAKRLGLNPNTLRSRLSKLQIQRPR
jgi:formate hydrogenlyase transcriptional activator